MGDGDMQTLGVSQKQNLKEMIRHPDRSGPNDVAVWPSTRSIPTEHVNRRIGDIIAETRRILPGRYIFVRPVVAEIIRTVESIIGILTVRVLDGAVLVSSHVLESSRSKNVRLNGHFLLIIWRAYP